MNGKTYWNLTCLCAFTVLFSGCFKTREEIEREKQEQEVQQTMHRNIYEASEGLQQTQSQIGRLQGRVEEVEQGRRREAEETRKVVSILADRLQKIDERLANSEKVQGELVEEIKKMKEESIRALAQPAATGKKNATEKSLYKLGLQAMKEKRFKEAAQFFNQYIEENPKAKTALEAHLYLGDAEFAQKNWAEAIVAYSFVYEKNQHDATWKKSTLKIAEAFQRLGKKKDARPFAQALVDRYPDSNEAKSAQKYLN